MKFSTAKISILSPTAAVYHPSLHLQPVMPTDPSHPTKSLIHKKHSFYSSSFFLEHTTRASHPSIISLTLTLTLPLLVCPCIHHIAHFYFPHTLRPLFIYFYCRCIETHYQIYTHDIRNHHHTYLALVDSFSSSYSYFLFHVHDTRSGSIWFLISLFFPFL